MLQEQQPEPPEKKVVVTASPLNPKDVHDTPWSADVVTGDDLQTRRLSRTLPDALKETPGVTVQKTSHGHGSPFIRGFTGFRNVLLVDGIRINNSIFREGPNQYWNTVDEFLIDRMDVVRGPSSVLWGSDSIGGTVNAITKAPDEFEPGFHWNRRHFYRYAGAEDSHTARSESWGNIDDFGYFMGFTYRDWNDIDGGGHTGRMPHTGYDEYAADMKWVYRLSDDSKLVLAVQHTRQDDVPRTHSTIFSKSWHGTTVGTDLERKFRQERDLVYLQYQGKFKDSFVDAVDASLSWHIVGETFRRTSSSNAREFRAAAVDTPALWARAGKETSFGYLTFGVEFYRDLVTSEGHNWSSGGAFTSFERGDIADKATYDLMGVYLQDELTFGSLDVTPGIRFTRARAQADEVDPNEADAIVFNDLDETYSAVTGSLRLLYHLDEEWNLIGGWGMGFRTPSLDDSTAIKLVMSGALDLPAEDLDPERSHTFDLGVRAKYDTWRASAFGFVTLLRDFIQRVPAGDFNGDGTGDFTKDNFAEGRVWGFELAGSVRVRDDVTVFADWAYVKGDVDAPVAGGGTSEQPLGKVNPSTAHVGVRYEPKEPRVWVEAVATIVRHQHHLSPADATDTQRIPPGGTPGYAVYGLRGGWQPTEKITLTASIENITNKDYRIHGSGQNEPGTNFIVGVDLRY